MPIYLNPFRLYRGRLTLNHGLIVDMLRNSQKFWEAYNALLEINGKKESDMKDLRSIMKQMGLVPKEKAKVTEERAKQIVKQVTAEFENGLDALDEMMHSLSMIIYDDETFLFRSFADIRELYFRFGKIQHLPDYMVAEMKQHFYALLQHMAHVQNHAWLVSKAHSRGFMKLEELSLLSNRAERRHIRQQTIELDHLRNRIEPLRGYIDDLRYVRTHDDIHVLHTHVVELLKLYHEEITDLKGILHESDVLIRRTEKLFKEIEREAGSIGSKQLVKAVHKYADRFHSILLKTEKQASRENMELHQLLHALPLPPRVAIQKAA